MKNQQLFSAGN